MKHSYAYSRIMAQLLELAQSCSPSKKSGHHAIAIDLPGMGRDKTPIMEVKMEKTVEKFVHWLTY